jgi:hypothetical protein
MAPCFPHVITLRIITLPEQMAQVIVAPISSPPRRAANSVAVVHHEIRMHLQRQPVDAMLARKFRRSFQYGPFSFHCQSCSEASDE